MKKIYRVLFRGETVQKKDFVFHNGKWESCDHNGYAGCKISGIVDVFCRPIKSRNVRTEKRSKGA